MARPTNEYRAFDRLVNHLLTVPKAVVAERIAAHRAQAALNPKKRGPKPKSQPTPVVPDPAAE